MLEGNSYAYETFVKTTGNTILVTGGGTGIGRGLAEAFHQQGNQVIIAGRQQSVLDATVKANSGMRALQLDIANCTDIERFASDVTREFPALNVVVNNAGIMKSEHMKDGTAILPITEQTVATNLLGPIRLTASLLPTMFTQSRATLITLSGGVAFVPMIIAPSYCATKAAIHSWTQSLRFQLHESIIEVLEIAPPYVQSELFTPDGVSDPHAMPLDKFISQVMDLLANPPPSGEILVEGVYPLRLAEKNGEYNQRFEEVNSMSW